MYTLLAFDVSLPPSALSDLTEASVSVCCSAGKAELISRVGEKMGTGGEEPSPIF